MEGQNNKHLELQTDMIYSESFYLSEQAPESMTFVPCENRLCRMHRKKINTIFSFCFLHNYIYLGSGICKWLGLKSEQWPVVNERNWLREGREEAKITDVEIAGLSWHIAKIPQVYEKILNRKKREGDRMRDDTTQKQIIKKYI